MTLEQMEYRSFLAELHDEAEPIEAKQSLLLGDYDDYYKVLILLIRHFYN
jgi:hypothetical protein